MLLRFEHGIDYTRENSQTYRSFSISRCVLVMMAVVVVVVVIFAGCAVDQRLWGTGDADECKDRAHFASRCRAHLEHNVVGTHRDMCLSSIVELALKHNTLIANCEDVFNVQPSIARQPRCDEGAAIQPGAHVASL